ncbi:MAG: histidine phosphatase family protein [Desulfobacteraceae bacterium]|nr:histidine phosphatase family protein [Desulfobacteraceae bacterium]
MGTLWFIRHGQACFGADEYDALSKTGYRQANALGRYFASAGIAFDAVYSGSMKRQTETARQAMAAASHGEPMAGPIILNEFNEYDFMAIIKSQLPAMVNEKPGLAEKSKNIFKDDATFVELFSIIFQRWISGTHDIPGAETFEAYKARIQQGVTRVIRDNGSGGNTAVFTSGGVIGVLVQRALNLSIDITMETGWQICNASISRFRIKEKGLVMAGFNSITHLEIEGKQDLITYR